MSPTSRLRQGKAEKGGSDKGPGKEWKASKASSKHLSIGTGMPTSAYNPGTGMFHMLDSSISEPVSNQSGRFRSIDDTEDVGSVIGSYSEYDSVSNNGSCSGESEDQLQNGNGKDRKAQPPGLVGGGSDKRDKIRYKNEKKHQRQKERRAQELRDRCTGYLMARKLEALAQQLVAMGFSPDRATMALILNEGHVERSVAWLLEGGEGQVKEDWNAEGSLKIDISEELARIDDLETRFKYLRVEIERAVVACEGDLEKAAEWLRDRHPQYPLVTPEYAANNAQDQGKEQTSSFVVPSYLMTAKGRGGTLLHSLNRRDDKELHATPNLPQGYQTIHSRPVSTGDGSFPTRSGPVNGTEWHRMSSFSVDKGKVVHHRVLRNPQQNAPLSYPPVGRHALDPRAPAHELVAGPRREQGLPLNARDPAVTPQVPVTPPSSVPSASVSPSLSPASWQGNAPGASSPSSVFLFNRAGDALFKGAVGDKATGNTLSKQAEEKVQPFQLNRPDIQAAWGGGSNGSTNFGGRENGLSSIGMPASSSSHVRTHSAPKFLSGWGSGLPGGPADWSMWVSSGCDYRNIDWSMGVSSSNSAEANVWRTTTSFASVLSLADSGKQGLGLGSEGESLSQGIYAANRNEASDSSTNFQFWDDSSNRGNSIPSLGLQEKPVNDSGNPSNMGIVPEWTSPFAGKNLFNLPHQAVPSPLL